MVLGGLPEQIVRHVVGSSPSVLNSEFHGVWAHSTLPVLLSGGMVHLPHKIWVVENQNHLGPFYAFY